LLSQQAAAAVLPGSANSGMAKFHRILTFDIKTGKLAEWSGVEPRNLSWTGWIARFFGRRARRNDAEWLFHSKELQRGHAPEKLCNPARSAPAKRVSVKLRIKLFRTKALSVMVSGQLRFLG
jgi:hypothetical protein